MDFSPVDGLLSAINYPRWVYLWASKMRGLRWYDHLKYTQRITEIDPLCHDCALNNWYGHIFFVLETAIFGTVFASSTATTVHSGDETYKCIYIYNVHSIYFLKCMNMYYNMQQFLNPSPKSSISVDTKTRISWKVSRRVINILYTLTNLHWKSSCILIIPLKNWLKFWFHFS